MTTLKDLTDQQIASKLQLLEDLTRRKLPDGAELPTRFEPKEKLLLRFLKSCQGNVEEAANILSDHIRWRTENKVDEISIKSADELFQGSARAKDIATLMPMIERGEDSEKRPVIYLIASKLEARAASKLVSARKLFEYQIWLRERALARLDLYGTGSWRTPPYYTVVVDLRGVRLNQATGEFYSLIRHVMDLDQYHYPGRAGALTIINVPFFFHMIWGALRGWLGSSAEKKICICHRESEAKRVLLSQIPHHKLPSDLGGGAFPLPSLRTGSAEEFFCPMVHMINMPLRSKPSQEGNSILSDKQKVKSLHATVQSNDDVEGPPASPRMVVVPFEQMLKESFEKSRSKFQTDNENIMDESKPTMKSTSRATLVSVFRTRLEKGEDLNQLKADILQEIQTVEKSTVEFERDVLIMRTRLRRRLERISQSHATNARQFGSLIPVGKDAIKLALATAQSELEAHERAVAFARNYLDVEANDWQQTQSSLRARLDRVLGEHRGLTRTVEVALGKRVLDKILQDTLEE